jgi:hypothetical protein
MTEEMITCPQCRGSGDDGFSATFFMDAAASGTCKVCGSTGKVPGALVTFWTGNDWDTAEVPATWRKFQRVTHDSRRWRTGEGASDVYLAWWYGPYLLEVLALDDRYGEVFYYAMVTVTVAASPGAPPWMGGGTFDTTLEETKSSSFSDAMTAFRHYAAAYSTAAPEELPMDIFGHFFDDGEWFPNMEPEVKKAAVAEFVKEIHANKYKVVS